ncbi:hypothetical protein GCM10009127_22060 [Alteraurantiacibacter aestuarii]|uniref:hypothetical protein n=1 Tax=Alteraurantiacibacter aestuarii TaxID=650004 RepID=UPI0031E1FD40
MKRFMLLGGAILALSSSLALAQPESLLPDIFDDPPPEPAPTPTPRATAARPAPAAPSAPGARPAPGSPGVSAPVVQQVPGIAGEGASTVALPADFPSLEELENMEPGEINELLGLRPKFDVPPAARRAMSGIGVIARSEGGLPSRTLSGQPAGLVRAALQGMRGPVVSRWGHILLRRALASRMDAPQGMNPVEFTALRAAALNNMGEPQVARALVQDVDTGNYDRALIDAAFDAYLASGDVLGMCPAARLLPTAREDGEWILIRAICDAYLGEARSAERRLARALGTGEAPAIDVRLAQRFAGAAGDAGRAVNIEWDGVDELTPWRFSLARALGVELPDNLRDAMPARFDLADALIPATPLLDRVEAADLAAQRGVMSSAAMVGLYSQLYSSDVVDAGDRNPGILLREAYVASDPAARLVAMRNLWGDGDAYGRQVLTAFAAARMPVSDSFEDDAADIIASMLAAGLDRNAMRWGDVVSEGSAAWGLLALAQESGDTQVSSGAVESYVDGDTSEDYRKSRFLLAGLAGLGRLDSDAISDLSDSLEIDLNRSSVWSARIDKAAQYGNPGLVALLAGLGMQGDGWDRMTARHLYHIVKALNDVGMGAEARMIAAEAVARG